MNKKAVLEGILFVVGDEGISIDTIKNILQIDDSEVMELLTSLRKDYESNERGLRISFLGNAFKLTTKEEHKEYYEKLVSDTKNPTLSSASLEVLAVIAYNEPVTRLKIDEIRGVNSAQIVRRLLARGFIKVCGKADSIGKPNLYKTTDEFLDYFGLASKDDLPEIIFDENKKDEEEELYNTKYIDIEEINKEKNK